jgi:hypothetical protein
MSMVVSKRNRGGRDPGVEGVEAASPVVGPAAAADGAAAGCSKIGTTGAVDGNVTDMAWV